VKAVSRLPLAITMGDPAGIGPEVSLKAIADPAVRRRVAPLLVGDPGVWLETARRLRLGLQFAAPGRARQGAATLIPTSSLPERWRAAGKPRGPAHAAACGEAAHAAIIEAVALVRQGRARAVVTAPISKAHLVAAGHGYPGHTELLAHLCGDVPVRMMMVGGTLRVVLVTIHMALREVPRRLTAASIFETIAITVAALRQRFRIRRPRIAVTGLNPHAGEDGLFGDEDVRVIAPAVRRARRGGVDAVGPLAADGVFPYAARGHYDAVVAMYHDQGLAPFKLVHFADGVNCTLGLPFVRTSPDHGTAFDIAGRDKADAGSMAAAILLAAQLAGRP
jgi:4-hydroxythreonine-4-phosphate dehydrogenase